MIAYHRYNHVIIPCLMCTKTWVCIIHGKIRYLDLHDDLLSIFIYIVLPL